MCVMLCHLRWRRSLHGTHFKHSSLLGGGAVSDVDPSSTGLNPAWRKALVHTLGALTWTEGTSEEVIESQREAFLSQLVNVRALAPESGAYFNEVCLQLRFFLRCLTEKIARIGITVRTKPRVHILRRSLWQAEGNQRSL